MLRQLTIFTCIILMLSCKKEKEVELTPLEADFSYSITNSANYPYTSTYKFKNLSKGANSYKWYFGNLDSSTLVEPSFAFTESGNHQIKLVISNSKTSKEVTKTIVVNIKIPVEPTPVSGVLFLIYANLDSPNTLRFKVISPEKYLKCTWDFGDNESSNEVNPTHTFQNDYENRTIKLILNTKTGDYIVNTAVYDNRQTQNSLYFESYVPISLNPLSSRIYQNNSDPLLPTDVSFTNSPTDSRLPYIDPKYRVQNYAYPITDPTVKSLYLYNYGLNVISYRKNTILNKVELQQLFDKLKGDYFFSFRKEIYDPVISPLNDTTYYNDTTLKINITNAKMSLVDTKVGKDFEGYLYIRPNQTDYKFNSDFTRIGMYSYYFSNLSFPINTDSINAYYERSSSNVGSTKTWFRGIKKQ